MHAPVVPLSGTVYEKVLAASSPTCAASTVRSAHVRRAGHRPGRRHGRHRDDRCRGTRASATSPTSQECARALAYVVVGCRRHTDLFEWAQRSLPFSLAAEIQRRLLPAAFTCEAGQLTVSGWLEPANAVGGDTFDYSLDRDTLHVSITDAVGHDVHAALLATLLVGACATAAAASGDFWSRPPRPTTRSPRTPGPATSSRANWYVSIVTPRAWRS